MKQIILFALCISTFAFANVTTNIESSEMASQVIAETSVSKSNEVEANYEFRNDGIPWNREFDSDRMVRHQTFDPALKVAYSYSLNFVAGSFGSFANQSFMGHFAYEFTQNLHLYANVGLWMPIYANISNGSRIAREDLRQGNVNVISYLCPTLSYSVSKGFCLPPLRRVIPGGIFFVLLRLAGIGTLATPPPRGAY